MNDRFIRSHITSTQRQGDNNETLSHLVTVATVDCTNSTVFQLCIYIYITGYPYFSDCALKANRTLRDCQGLRRRAKKSTTNTTVVLLEKVRVLTEGKFSFCENVIILLKTTTTVSPANVGQVRVRLRKGFGFTRSVRPFVAKSVSSTLDLKIVILAKEGAGLNPDVGHIFPLIRVPEYPGR